MTMRRSIFKHGQDICFLCALRLEAAPYLASTRAPRQVRAYKSSTPAWHPAGAAAAQREDDDDNTYVGPSRGGAHSPAQSTITQPPDLFWQCRCNHYNTPRRPECTVCLAPRPAGVKLGPKLPPEPVKATPKARPLLTPVPSQSSVSKSAQPPRAGSSVFSAPSLASSLTGPPGFRNAPQPSRLTPQEPRKRPTSFTGFRKDRLSQQEGSGPPAARSRVGPILGNATPERQLSQPTPRPPFGLQAGSFRIDLSKLANDVSHDESRASVRLQSSSGSSHSPASPDSNRSSRFGAFLANASQPRRESTEAPSRFGSFKGGLAQKSQRQWSPTSSAGAAQPNVLRDIDVFNQALGTSDRSSRRARSSPVRTVHRPGPHQSMSAPSQASGEPIPEDPTEPDPLIIAPLIDEPNGDYTFGRRRRSDKHVARDRRSETFDLDSAVASSTSMQRHRHQTSNAPQRRSTPWDTTFDLEMAEAEERLLEEEGYRKRRKQKKQVVEKTKPRVEIPGFISVQNLAQALGIRLNDFIKQLEEEGFEGARYDHVLDSQTSAMFAEVYGFEPIVAEADLTEDIVARPPAEAPSIPPPRPPIVTIMGHVDHGKTTILDWLRKSSVVASEHGGITQHIGAFSVTMPDSQRKITFLDTPGHAAFLDMRRRGANVTDIVVLVVAADDSVKPQTVEAIKHAKEAGVQIIVAMSKVDKEDANITKVKDDLARYEIMVEDYGGEYQAIPLSGKTGQGMEALEEAIITLADVSDFRAETDGPAEGAIIESKITAGGRVATILVRRGTLRTGDFIVAGSTWARVRTLKTDAGQLVSEALPGTPVQVDGWRGEDPTAGLEVLQAKDEQHAKNVVALRIERAESMRAVTDMAAFNTTKSAEAEARGKVLAWEKEQGWGVGRRRQGRPIDNEGWVEPDADIGPKRIHFLVKADVAGSAEAVVAVVSAIGNNEVIANVIHSGTGHLGESDIRLLAATGEKCYAINFNQPVEGTIHRLAEAAGVRILDHNIIYKVTDDVKEKLSDELAPTVTQKVTGEADVGQVFDISIKKGKLKIAGCKITNGTITRSQKVRVLRNNDVIYTGNLSSLKNVKKDVTEMRKGTECGMGFDGWEDFQEGDKIQCFEEIQEKRKLY